MANNKKHILSAAKKMRKVLKEQRKNKQTDGYVLKYYQEKYEKAYWKLLDLLID